MTGHALEQLIGMVGVCSFGVWRLVAAAGRRNKRSFDRHVQQALGVADPRPVLRVVTGGNR